MYATGKEISKSTTWLYLQPGFVAVLSVIQQHLPASVWLPYIKERGQFEHGYRTGTGAGVDPKSIDTIKSLFYGKSPTAASLRQENPLQWRGTSSQLTLPNTSQTSATWPRPRTPPPASRNPTPTQIRSINSSPSSPYRPTTHPPSPP